MLLTKGFVRSKLTSMRAASTPSANAPRQTTGTLLNLAKHEYNRDTVV